MCDRPVSELLAAATLYSAASPRHLEIISFRVLFSLGKRKKLQGAKSDE
jgi:hypothetical protein